MPTQIFFEVKAQGDTIYVRASSRSDAERVIAQLMGRAVLPLCTFKVVDKIPDGDSPINE